MNHLMIDIEALGQKPGCSIFELGAVVFDLETGVTGAQFLALIDPDNGFVDAATEQWHRERGTYPMPGTAERVGITTALANFARWYQCLGWDIQTVWSWGATYDFPVLDSRWQEWGPTEELPWKYYQAECARTIWRRAFADLKHDPRPHQALEDCCAAIKDLVAAHRALRGKEPSAP